VSGVGDRGVGGLRHGQDRQDDRRRVPGGRIPAIFHPGGRRLHGREELPDRPAFPAPIASTPLPAPPARTGRSSRRKAPVMAAPVSTPLRRATSPHDAFRYRSEGGEHHAFNHLTMPRLKFSTSIQAGRLPVMMSDRGPTGGCTSPGRIEPNSAIARRCSRPARSTGGGRGRRRPRRGGRR
jgi:hypothetical protein